MIVECNQSKCEYSHEFCGDEVFEYISRGISIEPTISAFVKVDTCVERPNLGEEYTSTLPEVRKEDPCYKYWSSISSLVITGTSSSEDNNGNRVKTKIDVPHINQKRIPEYMELYAPGTVLFVKGEYMLPSKPGDMIHIFNASILPISQASAEYLYENTGPRICRQFR